MQNIVKRYINSESIKVILINILFYSLSISFLNLFDYSFVSVLGAGALFIISQTALFFILKLQTKDFVNHISEHKLTVAVLLIALARIGMTLLHSFLSISSAGFYARLIVILSFLFLYALSIFTYYLLYKEISFEKLYVIQAILFGTVLIFVVPLYGVADEPQHMRTAYYVSNKMMGIETPSDGIYMRQDDSEFSFSYPEYTLDDINAYLKDLSAPLKNGDLVLVPNSGGTPQTIEFARRPFVFYSQQYQYYAVALGITIGRLLNMNTISVYLMGRAFNLLLSTMMIYIALKILPFGKSLLYSIALFPMTLQLAASTSRDAFRISLAILSVSLAIHLLYGDNEYSSRKKAVLYSCLFIMCALLFPLRNKVYVTIALLPLLLIANKKKLISSRFILICIGITAACIFGFTVYKTFIHPQPLVEEPVRSLSWDPAPGYSAEYFINHPIYLITMIRTTVLNRGVWYIDNMICSPLGWLNISIPDIFVSSVKILLLINLFKRTYEEKEPDSFFRITSFAAAFTSLLLVFVGMAITWTRNGIMEVEGIQGRYFTPLLLPLLLPFRCSLITVSEKVDKAAIPLLFLFNTIIVHYLIAYYI